VTKPWELISREHKGLVGRRAVVEKTFRLPDGRQAAFMVTGDSANRAVACIAVTARQTVLIAEQYRPGPERIMTELPGGAVDPASPLPTVPPASSPRRPATCPKN
jgi:ADP-ribose pyrophosphatase